MAFYDWVKCHYFKCLDNSSNYLISPIYIPHQRTYFMYDPDTKTG